MGPFIGQPLILKPFDVQDQDPTLRPVTANIHN